eukprot:CAMPEP_0172842612 /NCGR_PEP_ID=MMETSP1075-20121228/30862_1 /TAXON_ID=2916 /ORGANISM="Ceratium fusus, Strain PA161109" /LENGTH=64 /DNA_ID=CAMNT_0013686769 /DNA_START=58 /DNA_END=253 /DNA_ORIENTATION=-
MSPLGKACTAANKRTKCLKTAFKRSSNITPKQVLLWQRYLGTINFKRRRQGTDCRKHGHNIREK